MYELSFTYTTGLIVSFVVFSFDSLCDAIDSRLNDLVSSFSWCFIEE